MKLPQDTHNHNASASREQQEKLAGELTVLGALHQNLTDQIDVFRNTSNALHADNDNPARENQQPSESISALRCEEGQLRDGITTLFGTWCSMANLNRMVADQGMLRWNFAYTRHQEQKIEIQRRHIEEVQHQLGNLHSEVFEEVKEQVGQQQLYAH